MLYRRNPSFQQQYRAICYRPGPAKRARVIPGEESRPRDDGCDRPAQPGVPGSPLSGEASDPTHCSVLSSQPAISFNGSASCVVIRASDRRAWAGSPGRLLTTQGAYHESILTWAIVSRAAAMGILPQFSDSTPSHVVTSKVYVPGMSDSGTTTTAASSASQPGGHVPSGRRP